MIVFRQISWKNFLSTGDTPTTVFFDRSPTTLIIGENGSGKSTILDALTFGLFGKPFRSINKTQLINTINERGLLVEIDFSIGSSTIISLPVLELCIISSPLLMCAKSLHNSNPNPNPLFV